MVLKPRPRPALIVPDEASWTVWGVDPAVRHLAPAGAPEEAEELIVPEIVPTGLVGPLAGALERMPQRPRVTTARGPAVEGIPVADLLRPRRAGERAACADGGGDAHDAHDEGHDGHDEGHDGHDEGDEGHDKGHKGHEGHDMMAIVGEPSADGLVMEPIDLELGPLSGVLPGGLVASVRLDGDVVASCAVCPTLVAHGANGTAPPDPLAQTAWSTATAVAKEQAAKAIVEPGTAWRRVAGVELERAVSHLAWLRSLGRVMGWPALVDGVQEALGALRDARRSSDDPEGDPTRHLKRATTRAGQLTGLLEGRRLAVRARGRGGVAGSAPGDGASLAGPNGRAAGSERDARSHDPFYLALGFQPVVREAGDIEARVLVRAHEAVAATELASAALARRREGATPPKGAPFASAAGAAVEGPRGPILASVAHPGVPPILAAPGAEAATAGAAAAAEGQEWSAALLTIASFDLSAWRAGP